MHVETDSMSFPQVSIMNCVEFFRSCVVAGPRISSIFATSIEAPCPMPYEKSGGATDRNDPLGRLRLLEKNAEVYRQVVPVRC